MKFPCGGDINVRNDLSNYATKADLKNASRIDTSKLAAKSDLVTLKAGEDKLDINKLINVPLDLSKLSDVVKLHKKNHKFVAKLNSIDSSGVVLKTKYDTDKSNLENEIPDSRGLIKK